MNRKVVSFLALGLLIAVAGGANAQRGGRGGGGFGRGGLNLLNDPAVQTELKMTEEQKGKLPKAQEDIRAAMQELFQGAGGGGGFQNMSPEERQKLQAKMAEITNKVIAGILDATQLKRFHQIELQVRGFQALADPKVQDALKLTDAQKASIKQIEADAAKNRPMFDFQNATPEERQAFQAKMRDAQRATNEKLAAVLTDSQKKSWADMLGAPVTLTPGGPGGGRRVNPPPPPA